MMDETTIDDIRLAADLLKGLAHRTPVLSSNSIDCLCGASLFFKCENFQKSGSFKIRGAINAVLSLGDAEARRGVVTHSSGNFAQALALAGHRRGINVHVVMPRTAPEVKRRATAAYGAAVSLCEPTLEARERGVEEIIDCTGAAFIHPYDDWKIIAGQGTVGLELCESHGDLDAVVVPIGGGGLISGVALSVKTLSPKTAVIGAEPELADDAYRSLKSGFLQAAVQNSRTIADGLLTSLGTKTFPIIKRHVQDIVLVEERQIIFALRYIWERMKIIVEPSAAIALGAVFASPALFSGKRVGIVLSGGNVDLDHVPLD